jgi:hypothetical protein
VGQLDRLEVEFGFSSCLTAYEESPTDYPEPVVVADEFFRINLIVSSDGDSLRYDARFKRISTVKKRAPRYGREA